jgi:hypothetical protein
MPSTASVAMKRLFGVKLGRFYLHSTIWIDANHRRECGVSVLAVDKHSQASGAKSAEGSVSTIWIDANHRRECGVSVLPVDKHSQASGAKTVE